MLGILIVGGCVVLASLATVFVRRRVPEEIHQANNEVAGFIFATIGVLYAVLLAFIVLAVWQEFEEARVTVQQEANDVANLFRISQELPSPGGKDLQQGIIDYTNAVINSEWPAMQEGEESPAARDAFEHLWTVHREIDAAKTASPEIEYNFLPILISVGNNRRIRLLDSRSELSPALWGLLWGGAIVTIAFTLFFRAENQTAQILMTSALAGMVGFVLFLVIGLDSPFTGDIRVEPVAFQQVLDLISRLKQ